MKPTTLFIGMLIAAITLCPRVSFAQQSQTEKLARAYYAAFVNKDWNSLQGILADGFTFTSPVDDHISLNAFKERCWPNADKIKRCDIDKLVVSGDIAFVIYNGWTTDGKLFRNSDYFKIKDGKISEYECFFGAGINYPNSGK
jgi:ketosteroid isomerase-like protein